MVTKKLPFKSIFINYSNFFIKGFVIYKMDKTLGHFQALKNFIKKGILFFSCKTEKL